MEHVIEEVDQEQGLQFYVIIMERSLIHMYFLLGQGQLQN